MQAMTPKEMMQSYMQSILKERLQDYIGKDLDDDAIEGIKKVLTSVFASMQGMPEVDLKAVKLPNGQYIFKMFIRKNDK